MYLLQFIQWDLKWWLNAITDRKIEPAQHPHSVVGSFSHQHEPAHTRHIKNCKSSACLHCHLHSSSSRMSLTSPSFLSPMHAWINEFLPLMVEIHWEIHFAPPLKLRPRQAGPLGICKISEVGEDWHAASPRLPVLKADFASGSDPGAGEGARWGRHKWQILVLLCFHLAWKMRLFTDDMKLFGPRLSASILIAASIVCGRNHAS